MKARQTKPQKNPFWIVRQRSPSVHKGSPMVNKSQNEAIKIRFKVNYNRIKIKFMNIYGFTI